MEERKSNSTIWIAIVLIIVALMCCVAAVVGVGLLAYLIAQPASHTVSPEQYELRRDPREATVQPYRGPREGIPGALVVAVVPDSPADRAGLRPGDVIVAVNGAPVRPPESLSSHIGRFAPGDEIDLTVQRAEGERTLLVRLGRSSERSNMAWLGIEYRDLPARESPQG